METGRWRRVGGDRWGEVGGDRKEETGGLDCDQRRKRLRMMKLTSRRERKRGRDKRGIGRKRELSTYTNISVSEWEVTRKWQELMQIFP